MEARGRHLLRAVRGVAPAHLTRNRARARNRIRDRSRTPDVEGDLIAQS